MIFEKIIILLYYIIFENITKEYIIKTIYYLIKWIKILLFLKKKPIIKEFLKITTKYSFKIFIDPMFSI